MAHKKAQSSLEFLMTYGWAFLISIAVIVGLYALGIIDFMNWIPEYCRFDSQNINCESYIIDGDIDARNEEATDNAFVLLRLSNEFQEPIVITGCKAYYDGNPLCIDETDQVSTSYYTKEGDSDFIDCSNTIWPENKELNLKLTSCEFDAYDLQPGKKKKIQVELTYYPRKNSEAFTRTIIGDIFAKIDE